MALCTRALWQKRVDEWVQSALPGTLFAARHGLSVHALRWWKRQLSFSDKRGAADCGNPPLTFVELQADHAAGSRSAAAGGSFDLYLTGYRLRIPADFDPSTLSCLLTLLEKRGQR